MRLWFCFVLAACGVDSVTAPVAAPPAAASTAVPPPPPPQQSAAHGAEITALAITEDGLAAASADRLGGIRLWPVLDGTREPVVIQGTAPRALGILRDGDGFAIGALDAAGGVHLVRTTALGAVRGRATAAGDQPATAIASTPEGLLILRADQALELVDAGGVVRARLTPEPGTRVEALVARAGRVLALIREDKQLHGRWVVVRGGARWGEATPRLPFPIGRAVLSPSGRLLAVTRPRSLHPALIDLAKGTALTTPLCVTRRWPREGGDDSVDDSALLHSDNAPVPLGFLTDTVVACAVMTAVTWWGSDGTPHQSSAGAFPVAGLASVMSDRGLVVGAGPNLGFATPQANRFLGYTLREPTALRVTSTQVLVGGADHQSFLLEAGLAERARLDVNQGRTGRSDWADVVPIDDRYALVTATRRSADRRDTWFPLAVFDGVTGAVHQQLAYRARDMEIAYEPASRLVATSDGAMALVLRYDPVSHTLGDPVRIGNAIAPSKLILLDPRRSGGIVALAIDQASDGLLIGELRDGDLRPGTTVQPPTSYTVPGELRAVDLAGQLYLHRPLDRDDVAVYRRDTIVARLPDVASMTLRPSADGSRIAAFHSPRLVLLTGAGRVAWSGAGFEWTPAGELVVQFPTGLGRIDLETGELTARRCGWGFGLVDRMLEVRTTGPSICDAPR